MSIQLRVFEDEELPLIFELRQWKEQLRVLRQAQGDMNWEIGECLIVGKKHDVCRTRN
jgi:hypothetical protein